MKYNCKIIILLTGFLASACSVPVNKSDGANRIYISDSSNTDTSEDRVTRDAIISLWQKNIPQALDSLTLMVRDGTVLMSGSVPIPQMRMDAVRLAWQPDSVKELVNEVRVNRAQSFPTYSKDNAITVQVRARLTFDPDIVSIHYSIETVGGVVYLMGHAKTQIELNKVIKEAHSISGVKQVISYVSLQ